MTAKEHIQMESFHLDRKAFSIQSLEEATLCRAYWLQKTARERLSAAWYLICAAYQLEYSDEHRLDRHCFKISSRKSV